VEIHPRFVFRVLSLALAAGLIGFSLIGIEYSISEARWAGLGTAAIFFVFGFGLWRMATASLTLDRETFVVRSFLKTTRVLVTEVDRFDIGFGTYGIDLLLLHSFRKISVNGAR